MITQTNLKAVNSKASRTSQQSRGRVIPMDNHSENFEKTKAQLHERGYHEKDVTITSACE